LQCEQRPQRTADAFQILVPAGKAIHDTDGVLDDQPQRPHLHDRLVDLPAGGDDILDHDNPLAGVKATFDQIAGAVGFGGLADVQARFARLERERRRQRDTAQFQPGQFIEFGRQEFLQFIHDRAQQHRIALEAILVPKEGADFARTQPELTGQVRCCFDPGSQFCLVHIVSSTMMCHNYQHGANS